MNTRHLTLGTFVLVTLGAFGWLAMQLGLGDRGGTHYLVRTPDAAGLVEGNAVRIAGVDVGKVDRIHVEGNVAVIDIRIRKDTTVFADACAAVHIKGMLGEKYLGIDQAAEGTPMAARRGVRCVTRHRRLRQRPQRDEGGRLRRGPAAAADHPPRPPHRSTHSEPRRGRPDARARQLRAQDARRHPRAARHGAGTMLKDNREDLRGDRRGRQHDAATTRGSPASSATPTSWSPR
jgi:hypothetical protein